MSDIRGMAKVALKSGMSVEISTIWAVQKPLR
jgi:hypothetical protein